MGELKPLCIVPARGGSKRLYRKNIAHLAGKPLLSYTVETALACGLFDQICVSSDDEAILEVAKQAGAQVPVKRPEHLASDTAQVKDVCTHLINAFAEQGKRYDAFAVLLPTSPFRRSEDLSRAYEKFQQSDANYLMSVVPYSHPPQRAVWAPEGYLEAYFGLQYMKQTQKLEKLYRHDGAIFFARTKAFLKEGEMYGTKVMPYYMEAERSVDIDQPLDLAWAEFMFARLKEDAKEAVDETADSG